MGEVSWEPVLVILESNSFAEGEQWTDFRLW